MAAIKAPAPLTPEEIDALEPTYLGPTWRRTDAGKWLLPERTLGWQILGWCREYLNNFDGTPGLKLTPEQARFILWWYAVDEHGDFIYNRGVLQRLKGWGKDPLLAVLAIVEFVGPCRFAGWDANGEPIAEAHPNALVQVAAVNQNQTSNTTSLLPTLLSDKAISAYGIKIGAELTRARNGRARLEAVTSSYRALEGKRTTFVIENETQHWVRGNNGDKMHETIDGNATKMNARYLAITNAPLPGEDSVAERVRHAYEKMLEGSVQDPGYLYDSIEAHPDTPLTPEALRIVLPKIRGDAMWLDIEAIIKSVLDPMISPSRSRRMYLNMIVAAEDQLYSPADWEVLFDPKAVLAPGDEIVLGFDGGKTDDATALMALRVRDMCAFKLAVWERPDIDMRARNDENRPHWEVPRESVNSQVHEAFRIYTVKGFYADVSLWESYIAEWEAEYGEGLAVRASERNAIGWDMRQSLQRVTRAHERLMRDVLDRRLKHNGDLTLRRHFLNAMRRDNNYGVSFGKESRESPRKVDLYAALMLAHECLYDLRTRGKKTKTRTGRGYFM